jgi:hypothetical protein
LEPAPTLVAAWSEAEFGDAERGPDLDARFWSIGDDEPPSSVDRVRMF